MYHIYLDIETLPGTRPAPEDIPAPGNYKDPEKIRKYQEDKVEEEHRKQALDSMQGEILCIGFAVGDANPQCFYRDDIKIHGEYEILTAFEHVLNNFPLGGFYLIGHNVKKFDLQWLWRKAIKYQLANLACLIPRHRYSEQIQDTAELWAGPDFRDYTKLDDIASFLGIPNKDGMDGSQVYDYWLAREHDKIIEYNKQDVEMVRQVYKAINMER